VPLAALPPLHLTPGPHPQQPRRVQVSFCRYRFPTDDFKKYIRGSGVRMVRLQVHLIVKI
jgi:hypothetical protein